MTNRLTIHLPNSSITFETEEQDKILKLSEFCKTKLDAYHSTENIDELTVDELSEEMSEKLHSLIFDLELI